MQVSPALQAGTPLHVQAPATHVLALLPQSASIQQSVAGMHVPLQSFSPATVQDVAVASRPESAAEPVPESCRLLDDPRVEEELVPPVASPASPPSTPLTVDEDPHPTRKTLNARPQIDAPTSRMTPP
jgi:hypothetical protein